MGKLIYITVTCTNITYDIGVLSQFMQAPCTIHLDEVYHVLAYIKRAPRKGLLYHRQRHIRIEAYSDAGYARDKGDWKFLGGYVMYVGSNLVSWWS